MTLEQIKQALADGKQVYWVNKAYSVQVNGRGEYYIRCTNGSSVGLTWADGVTMNGKQSDFFVA